MKRRDFLKAAAAAGAGISFFGRGESQAFADPLGIRAASVFVDDVPERPDRTDSGALYELGMRFTSTSPGQITALRYYKAPSETGAHTGQLWEVTQNGPALLASALFVGETTSGWQQRALPVPIPIRANRVYVVSVNCNGYFAYTRGDFTAPITHASLSATHGVLSTTPGDYPAQPSAAGNNYFRDVIFTPAEMSLAGQTPERDDLDDAVDYELGAIVRKPRRGKITAIRYWRSPSDVGPHVGHIWAGDGTLLDTVTFVDEEASGWQQQALSVPRTIEADTDYVVSVSCNRYFPDVASTEDGLRAAAGQFPSQAAAGRSYLRDVVFVAENAVFKENQKRGHDGWKIDMADYATGEIAGYANAVSVNRGGTIELKVSVQTAGLQYKIHLYRLGWYGGVGARQYWASGVRDGLHQDAPVVSDPYDPDVPIVCDWQTTDTIELEPSWPSGLYYAKLTELGTNKKSAIWFVVRDDESRADILFQANFTTLLAYNTYGGHSLYDGRSLNQQRARKVSFERPFSQGALDDSGIGIPKQPRVNLLEHSIFHLHYNMARWLESQGYDVTYVTNMEVHSNPTLLDAHKTFLSVGHDEYWSEEMRNNVEGARDRGVNLAFFSANTAYWRVRFEDSDRSMVCYKEDWANDPIAPTNRFRSLESGNYRPENALLGVMFCGFRWSWNEGDPFVVAPRASADPYLAFTGLNDGDTINGLIGFEWDTKFENGQSPSGLVTLGESEVTSSRTYSDTDGGLEGPAQQQWGSRSPRTSSMT